MEIPPRIVAAFALVLLLLYLIWLWLLIRYPNSDKLDVQQLPPQLLVGCMSVRISVLCRFILNGRLVFVGWIIFAEFFVAFVRCVRSFVRLLLVCHGLYMYGLHNSHPSILQWQQMDQTHKRWNKTNSRAEHQQKPKDTHPQYLFKCPLTESLTLPDTHTCTHVDMHMAPIQPYTRNQCPIWTLRRHHFVWDRHHRQDRHPDKSHEQFVLDQQKSSSSSSSSSG